MPTQDTGKHSNYDHIAFESIKSKVEDYMVLDIRINGFRLVDILKELEIPYASIEGKPGLAGHYEGLPPLLCLPPQKHFWGMATTQDYALADGRIAILESGWSGVPGEFTFATRISVDGEKVIWSDLSNVQRGHWDYRMLGPMYFELRQYRNALEQAAKYWY